MSEALGRKDGGKKLRFSKKKQDTKKKISGKGQKNKHGGI